ncbi:GNAT family N-acetyltransferase [Nonomuraea sp. NPDC003709]|uniref:GNAT family N-acetyltransferase n=1 Tax=Nonomuraea sp. NPDC003709 TaxID=3154450 RepID=UPI0033B5645A
MHTARLRLRAFDDEDANALFALHSSAYVLRYWDTPPWSERVRAAQFITACQQMAQDGTGARLAVDRVSDGAFIGWCSLTRWNPDYRSASLGYCFDAAAWGHGYATEAARALLRWAFDTLDLNRVQAEADTRNVAAVVRPGSRPLSSWSLARRRPAPGYRPPRITDHHAAAPSPLGSPEIITTAHRPEQLEPFRSTSVWSSQGVAQARHHAYRCQRAGQRGRQTGPGVQAPGELAQ